MGLGTPAPFVAIQYFTNNGTIASAHKLFTYQNGTTTKATTWTDAALTIANTNPIVLDSSGRCTIFLNPGSSYTLVLAPPTDTDPPASPIWTRDGVLAVPLSTASVNVDITGTSGEAIGFFKCCYLSDGSGGKTVGRWYLASNANDYSSTAAQLVGFSQTSVLGAGATTTFRIAGATTPGGLTAGTVYYINTAGGLTFTRPGSNARAVVQALADGTAAIIGSAPDASASISGFINAETQTLAGQKTFSLAPKYAPGTVAVAAEDAIVSGVFYSNVTAVGNVGGGTDDLMTTTIKANTLSANGKMLRVTATGDTAANANNKTLTFSFGGTTTTLFPAGAYNAILWQAVHNILRLTSGTARVTTVFQYSSAGGSLLMTSSTYTIDLTTDLTLKFTGVGTADNDIRQLGMVIEAVG